MKISKEVDKNLNISGDILSVRVSWTPMERINPCVFTRDRLLKHVWRTFWSDILVSFLFAHWYPFLVMSDLSFNTRVNLSLMCSLNCVLFVWCDTYQLYSGQHCSRAFWLTYLHKLALLEKGARARARTHNSPVSYVCIKCTFISRSVLRSKNTESSWCRIRNYR